jgi:trehalose 6-phosphate phosphatase
MTSPSPLPAWNTGWALFMDVDGTLVDIRPDPNEVRASLRLKRLLAAAGAALDGAVALVSGRSIASLDLIFAPLCLPAAGLHGLERRDAQGRVHYPVGYAERISAARGQLVEFVQSQSGLLLEDKGATLALHYRNAPELESLCEEQMALASRAVGDDFHVQRGKMVLELKPSGQDKGTAIEAFMAEEPFRGREPVFIGDDITDEDGFRAVNAMGGISVCVGGRAGTAARRVVADVAAVLDWLDSSVEHAHAGAT